MHILLVSYDFPTHKTIDYMFTDQLARAFVNKGNNVTVISPQSIVKCIFRNIPIAKSKSKIYVTRESYFTLLRPKYISAGTHAGLFQRFIDNSYSNAICRAFNSIKEPIDVCIGEFWGATKDIYPFLIKKSIPLFTQCGEEEVTQQRIGYSDEDVINISNYVSGVINVSTKNENESRRVGLIKETKTCVIPNGIDDSIFYPRDRDKCREKLGIVEDDFVVAFLGQFNSRKGVLRLDNALKHINNKNIKVIYMGRGIQDPTYEGIVFKGTVMHETLPEYLSAADVFVLPTNNEGCANAVIEAMACGLPIITADLPFSYDVLDNDSALLINPESESEIEKAILKIKNNLDLRQKLSAISFEKSKDLTLEKRVNKIIDYINKQLKIQCYDK